MPLPRARGPRTTRATARPVFPTPPPVVLRARHRLLGLYVLLGLTLSSWLARLPTVRSELDLSTGELGTILLLGAVGSLLTVLVAGAVVVRWGSVATMVAAAVVFSVANLLLGLGPTLGSALVLVVGVVLLSASFALGNVPMNVETVTIERAMGRTIVPQFHAAFSVGSVLGSGVGAVAAWGQVPLLAQFAAISAISLVWRLRAIPGSVLPVAEQVPVRPEPAHRRGAALRDTLGAWRERRTIVVGVVVMAAALSEGSANNWLAIGVVDGFGQSEAVAAVVFGVFVASMTVARLLGTALLDRYGRVVVLTASGLTGLAGVGIFALGPSLPLAVVGVVCWGLGSGLVVPIGMAAVSADPLKAPSRVAVVSAFASVASLGAPPLIGMVAEHIGVRHALLFVCVGMVAATLLAREAGSPDRPTSSHQPAVRADEPVVAPGITPGVTAGTTADAVHRPATTIPGERVPAAVASRRRHPRPRRNPVPHTVHRTRRLLTRQGRR